MGNMLLLHEVRALEEEATIRERAPYQELKVHVFFICVATGLFNDFRQYTLLLEIFYLFLNVYAFSFHNFNILFGFQKRRKEGRGQEIMILDNY